jgi:anhydro-N-acetylmuramic acid kinase
LIADPEIAAHGPLTALERGVTESHVSAVQAFAADEKLALAEIDLVGLHGQTVLHRPHQRFTRQLMDGRQAAAMLGRPVVCRFRHADVAAGGQGAPFVPLYHRALAAALPQPVMVLNLGGVANITWINGDTVIACDTGPASAILDDFMKRRRGVSFDQGGKLAASGTVNAAMVAAFMDNPFFDRPPPKSLDRNDFHRRAQVVEALSDADGAATLTAFTVAATCAILRHVPVAPRRWVVAGGGRLNLAIMEGLRNRLGVPVDAIETLGWNGDFTEAECFAYLAVRSRDGLPLSLPTTTGVPEPMKGGELFLPG